LSATESNLHEPDARFDSNVESPDDRLERLRAEAEKEFPPAWRPDQADQPQEIVGRFVELNPSAHTAFGPVPVVTLEGPQGGMRSVWLHHTVLYNAFIRLRPEIGETVYIHYLGKVEPKGGGARYADYRVAVDRPEAARTADWNLIAASKDGTGVEQPATADSGRDPEFTPPAPADDDIPF
jgi:hypothetical protein